MNALDKLPGIKHDAIRKCMFCDKGVAYKGHPLFYRVTIEQCGLMRDAINRQTGLEMMMGGNAVLANIMGANEDMAKIIHTSEKKWVCVPCSLEQRTLISFMEDEPETNEVEG